MKRKFVVRLVESLLIFFEILSVAAGVAPNIDYSNNMRVLRLPKSTKNGTIVYRLKGSDPDPEILTFGVEGEEANNLLLIKAASFTEADVILKSSLEKEKYFFTLYVTDGKEITRTDASIVVTNPESVPSPFLDVPPVIIVPENTPTNASIGFILAKEMDDSNLAVTFEIKGSDSFAIRYVFGPRGTSKAEILLVKPVDYERKNVYPLTILAMNAWKNETVDTRNVATASVVVVVSDVQDEAPQFTSIPLVVQLSESQKPEDLIFKVKAEDFDFGNPRNITYQIVQNKPWSSYFRIEPNSGEVYLVRSVTMLRDQFSDSMPILLTIKAREIGPSLGFPAMEVSGEVAIVVINTENHAPQFEAPVFRGTIPENSPLMTTVTWEEGTVPKVKDPDQGSNGTFLLLLDDVHGAFDVTPSKANGEAMFYIVVKYPSFLDYDVSEKEPISLQIVAKEVNTPQRFSATAIIRIKVTDVNDNVPQFTQSRYEASIPEKVKAGTPVITIKATDKDSGLYGDISYRLRGTMAGNFNIDSATGEVTVLTDEGFDREKASEYVLTVEARDERGLGNFNDTQLVISLLDTNDNKPIFTQPRYDAVLQSDCQSFYDQLVIRAYDADESGPNSNVSYEIINGNYQEKFLIHNQTGVITLREPITKTPGTNGIPGIPPITMTVRAHDQGIPVQYASVKVHIHGEEYLNRTINFIVPFEEEYVKDRIVPIGKGLSELTGSPTNILSVTKFNSSEEKSMVQAWIAYPLTTTVNLIDVDNFLSRMLRKESQLEREEETRRVPVAKYATVFWILIVLVILIIIAIICCCCYFCCVRLVGNKLKKEISKVTPQEKIIILKDQDGNESMKNAWDDDNETWVNSNGRLLKKNQHSFTPGVETLRKEIDSHRDGRISPRSLQTREPLRIDDRPMYAGANLRIEPRYDRGGAQSVETEYVLQEGRKSDGRQVQGGYIVVRRNMDDYKRRDLREREQDNGIEPKRTEIMYIRSPPKESRYDRPYNEEFLPRSVSETDLYQSRQKANREYEAEQRSHSLNSHFQKGKPTVVQPNVQPNSLRFSRHHNEAPYVGSYRDQRGNEMPRNAIQSLNPSVIGSDYPRDNRWNGPMYHSDEHNSYQRQNGTRNSNMVTTLGNDPTRVSPVAFDRPEGKFSSQQNMNEAGLRLMPAGHGGQFAIGQTRVYPDQRKGYPNDPNREYPRDYPNNPANVRGNYPGNAPREYQSNVNRDYPTQQEYYPNESNRDYVNNQSERYPRHPDYPNDQNARPPDPRNYQSNEMLKNQYNQNKSGSIATPSNPSPGQDLRRSYSNHESEREYIDAVRYNNIDYPSSIVPPVQNGHPSVNTHVTHPLNAIREQTSSARRNDSRSRESLHPSARRNGRNQQESLNLSARRNGRNQQESLNLSARRNDHNPQEPLHPSARINDHNPQEPLHPSARINDHNPQEPLHPSARINDHNPQEPLHPSARINDHNPQEPLHPSARRNGHNPQESLHPSTRRDHRISADVSHLSHDHSQLVLKENSINNVRSNPNENSINNVRTNPNENSINSLRASSNELRASQRDIKSGQRTPVSSEVSHGPSTPVIQNQPVGRSPEAPSHNSTPKERYTTPLDHIEQFLAPSIMSSRTSPIFDTGHVLDPAGKNLCDESKLEKRAIIENRDGHVFIIETDRPIPENDTTTTNDEDSDSGIGGHSLKLKKGSYLEKKSVFTIAYDGMQTQKLKSSEGRHISP